jgi:hypothetical protein
MKLEGGARAPSRPPYEALPSTYPNNHNLFWLLSSSLNRE